MKFNVLEMYLDFSGGDSFLQNSRFIILPALINSGSLRVLKLAKCNIPDADSMALGNDDALDVVKLSDHND